MENKEEVKFISNEIVEKTKLAKADINVLNLPDSSSTLFATQVVDKMELPKDFSKLIELCRFFYKYDPVAGCYDDTTEVLTRGGWRYFKDITENDEFATLDHGGNLVYQKAVKFINDKYDGDMLHFFSRKGSIDLLVTPNHNMFVAKRDSKTPRNEWGWSLEKAKDVAGSQFLIKKSAKWAGDEKEWFEYKSFRAPMDEWLKFFGMWIAEGCVSKIKSQHAITISHYNKNNLAELRELIEKWWIEPHNVKREGTLQFSHKHLHEYLLPLTGAHNKYIPDEYKCLSSRQIQILLDYYRKGDGNGNTSDPRRVAWTSSTKLCDDLMELCLKANYNGASFYISSKKGSKSYLARDDRYITSNYDGYRLSFIKKTNGVLLKRKHVSVVKYTGSIHCVEVPNHTLYVRREGKACWCGNSVLNKMVDCTISPIRNNKMKCTDEEFYVFEGLKDLLNEFYRNVCLEYLLSGLVIPQYEWSRKSGSEIHENLEPRRRITVPDNMWFRDPKTVEIKDSPIPNQKTFWVEVDPDLISFIKNKGKWKDGTTDKETYELLKKNYPEFVREVEKMSGVKMRVKLEGVRPLLHTELSDEIYPMPYMINALESLMHKRNLRKMDYSIAARVTAAIQLIKLGDKDFPCTDEQDFVDIKKQMNYRTSSGESERIFQLFANHTLVIEWVHPDTSAMLNQDKYKAVDDDIIAGLGFPRTLITGETTRSNVEGGSDISTFSPIATMEGIRGKLLKWTKVLYQEIKDKNSSIKNVPLPTFEPLKLYKLIDLSQIGESIYKEGTLSRTTRLEMVGLDMETELERMKVEKEKYDEYGIDPAPMLPYSSPNIPNKQDDNKEVDKEEEEEKPVEKKEKKPKNKVKPE